MTKTDDGKLRALKTKTQSNSNWFKANDSQYVTCKKYTAQNETGNDYPTIIAISYEGKKCYSSVMQHPVGYYCKLFRLTLSYHHFESSKHYYLL